MENWQRAGFGLYVHWPFCMHKCPYCDFNSHVTRKVDQDAWRTALVAELERVAELTPGRRLDSIFFGGGTPSLMPVETVDAVILGAERKWGLSADVEITLEANPTSVESARFRGYSAAGVNRVSLGVQSLRDDDLRRLGRMHSAAEAIQAIEIARKNFSRVSFDLIYARQEQTLAQWQAELGLALALSPDHVSLYQLTIEGGTRFGDMLARGKLPGLPNDALSADLYAATQILCAEAGLPAYEVSNHCRPGQESRHNLIYWRGGDFAGIGPGAHGRLGLHSDRMATQTLRDPAAWLQSVQAGQATAYFKLNSADFATEYLLMSLRLTEGSDVDVFSRLGGVINEAAWLEMQMEGFLHPGDRLAATEKGRIVLNSVLARLLREP